jgi:spermidine synthase
VRLLGLSFGVTIYAISTVLAAFMGGLALGSLIGGRRADSARRPLAIYGLVEIGVGLTALATPWAFAQLQEVYAATPAVVAGPVRAALAFTVLLVPTGLMGATLPLAVRGVRARSGDARGDSLAMGLLYAANTTGAIVGCLGAGFMLIGKLGLGETIAMAAVGNGVAGVGGLALSRVATLTSAAGDHSLEREVKVAQPAEARLARAALITFSVSGALSLAYEVVWSRILAVLFDASIYGFVLMLATVLAGIAIGGAVAGVIARSQSVRAATMTLALLELGIGLAAVLALVAFGGTYDVLTAIREHNVPPLARLVRTDLRLMAMLCVTTVLPAALLMGATFPIAARLWAAGSSGLGRRLGGIYAGNVAGAIVGSLAAGFVIVPLLGAHHGLLLLAAGNVAVAVGLLAVAGAVPSVVGSNPPRVGRTFFEKKQTLAAVIGAFTLAFGFTRPPIHERVFAQHFPDQQLVAYWEGLENTVSVGRTDDGVQTLFTNSRGQTNDSPDLVRYHRVMGHLAALLAPNDQVRALVVGLGAGATPGAMAQHSGVSIDVVELSPSVALAAPLFRVANADVLSRPNVRLMIDDGRNFLLRNRLAYDVITADVVHPYDAGATNLYSVEYFRLVARSLKPDGIMVQWVSPGSAFEHALIVRTLLQAFPNSTLWLGGDLLIGSPSPLALRRDVLDQRLADPSARAALEEVGFNHAQDVLAQYRTGPQDLAAYAGDGPILTDDHPILEYFQSQDIPPEPPNLEQFHSLEPV